MSLLFFYDSEERKTTNRMSKRVAERELTDRNWDQEDEVEEVSVKAYYFNYYLIINLILLRRPCIHSSLDVEALIISPSLKV